MFKKLRDKITEEVQQTTLKLPVSVQQLSQLSPFTGSGGDNSDPSRSPQNSIQDELLVDISEIQPAGDNKDLFSIDEDSGEGTPSKSSEFQIIELADDLTSSSSTPQKKVTTQLANNSPFDPSTPLVTTPIPVSARGRRWSESSNISEVSGLFPIYEVPGVTFNTHIQSDLESCGSEWEDSSGGLDRLSKDTLYQAYLRMRQRYHKYKGRYTDIAKAFEEKEKESEKLREVLGKQQDKAVRRVSELREQCSLEQQAKAHLEEELRSDLEEKDHKIEALQTKVRLLQEGYLNENSFRPPFYSLQESEKSTEDDERRANSLPPLPPVSEVHQHGNSPADESDNVSVGSLGSISTAPASLESDELIERLKGDIAKHKTLLGRCMDNIKGNKICITQLKQENDLLKCQLQEKTNNIDILKLDHEKELDSLRASVESSALSMAETKQQLFEELQTKEAEVDLITKRAEELETFIKDQQEQIEELKAQSEEELEIDLERQQEGTEVKNLQELESKCSELENLVADLQRSKKELELQLENSNRVDNQPYENSIKELEMQVANMSDNYGQLEVKLNAAVCEKDKLNQELAALLQKLSELNSEKENLSDKLRNALEGKNQINLEKTLLTQELTSLTDENLFLKGEIEKCNVQTKETLNKLNDEFDIEKSTNDNLVKLCDETKANCDKLLKEKEEIVEKFKCELEEQEKLLKSLEICIQGSEVKLKNSEKVNIETKSALDNSCDKLANLETTNHELNSKIQEQEKTLNEKIMQLDDLNKLLEGFRDLFVSHLEITSSTFNIDIVSKKLKALITNKSSLENKVEEFQLTCSTLEESLLKANSEIKYLKTKEHTLQVKLVESKESNLECEMEITEFQKKLSESEAKLAELAAKLISSQNQLSESNATLKEYKFKLSESNSKLSGYESELSISCSKLSNYESLLSEANAKLADNQRELADSSSKLTEFELKNFESVAKQLDSESKLSECSKNLADSELKLSELITNVADYESKLLECNVRLHDYESLKQNIDELKQILQVSENNLILKHQEIEEIRQQLLETQANVITLESIRKDYEEKESVWKLKESQIDSYLTEIEKLNAHLEEKFTFVSSLESKLLEKECLIETLNNELETGKLQHGKIVCELSQNLENSKEFEIKISKEMENQLEILAEKLKIKENELENLFSQLSLFEAEQIKFENLLEIKSNENIKLINDINTLENDNKTLLSNKNSLENDIAKNTQINNELKLNENTLKENLAKFERKIMSLVKEKKIILKDFEDQTSEYETSLEEKDLKYKNTLIDYEKKIEETTSEYQKKVENITNLVEKLSHEKETLQEQLVHLDSIRLQKDVLETQFQESEIIRSQLESTHVKRCREIEEEWQTKLRCELERIQSERDHRLAEVVKEAQQKQGTQLPEELESLRRSLARKDCELAQLKDACDSLRTEVEFQKEEIELRLEKEKESKLKNDELENEVELLREKFVATETQMEKQVLSMERSNGDLRQEINTLQNELSTLETQMKGEASNLEVRLLKESSESEGRLKKNFEESLRKEKEASERILAKEKSHFKELLKKSLVESEAAIAEKDKCFSELSSKFEEVQQEVERLRNICELKTQEWQDLDQGMNLLLQETGSNEENQERSRIFGESATGVKLKIQTLYQGKNDAYNELGSIIDNYRTLEDETSKKSYKLTLSETQNKVLEEEVRSLEDRNLDISSQLQSLSESYSELETSVASLKSQLEEEKKKVSNYEICLNEINQVVNSIPHLPPTDLPRDIKSVLLFLATEVDNLKKQMLEEITISEELNKEAKDLKNNFLSLKQNLTESETENNYLCSKLSETETKLRLLQEEIQAKISTVQTSESQTILDLITEEGVEESINHCKAELHKEYEENLNEMKSKYEGKQKETERVWKEKTAEIVREREKEMQLTLDQLTEQWNKEKMEVERLTQMASAAFRSGTDSMDLLKKQVMAQKKELDDAKRRHKKEIEELQALLEVKRRRGRGNHGEVTLRGSLEDSAEFEYLKNILYQYMLGKETQTLSKVLCAVVKFSDEQQRLVVEHEDNKQSLSRSEEMLSSQADNNEKIQSESQ